MYIGMFVAEDDVKILPYLDLLRNSIYEYVSIELFEDAERIASGSSYVNFKKQRLEFGAINDFFISSNLVGNVSTSYNLDCILYADVVVGSPKFYISSNGTTWVEKAIGSQFYQSLPTATWYVKIISQSSSDVINSFGIIFGRKPKYRVIISTDV